jgi:dolichol-phosphate mannosyltransferase
MKLSVVIPAHNEEATIGHCLDQLTRTLRDQHGIPYEIIVVNDNSSDETERVVRARAAEDPAIGAISRPPPKGMGRAIRSGLERVTGEVVVVFMADLSDDPNDVVAYYRKIQEGYDCVFGSRFIEGGSVENYPVGKRIMNRAVNRLIQMMFRTRFNDMTNAFKAYRMDVIRECGPYRASHFNITIEMSLGALIRRFAIAQIPIRWYGRTWGSSNLSMREMGARYLCVLLKLFFEQLLIADDLPADRRHRAFPEKTAAEPERIGSSARPPKLVG